MILEGPSGANSLWADRYGSWLMSRENSPCSSVCFCVHERQRKKVHRRLPAASCVWGFTLATVTWAGRVFSLFTANTWAYQPLTERKAFWGRHPGIICISNRLPWWVLCLLELEKHWLKLSDYLLKVNNHSELICLTNSDFWILIFFQQT